MSNKFAIDALKAEWDRMQPGRYRTMTESDEDEAWLRGFDYAIDFLIKKENEAGVDKEHGGESPVLSQGCVT